MLFTTTILYLVVFILRLAIPTTAQPLSRFSHHIETLQPRATHHSRFLDPRNSRLWHFLESRLVQRNHLLQPRSSRLSRRGLPGAVYICTQENFRGDCAWSMPNAACHIAGTGDDSPKSIGPDPGGFCVLFEKATCTGNQLMTFRYPGVASAVPAFQSLKCYADGQGANATTIAQNGGYAGSGILPSGKSGDPRLAGGAGSAERKKLQEQMAQMEKDGFRQGLLGLKKGHYY